MPFGRPGGRSILSVVPSVAAAAAVLPPSDGTEGKRRVEREESREEGDVEGLPLLARSYGPPWRAASAIALCS
jgi:hypothetical protein